MNEQNKEITSNNLIRVKDEKVVMESLTKELLSELPV